jgi:hypothetical protein
MQILADIRLCTIQNRRYVADADGNVLRSSSRTVEGQAGTCRESETRMLV